MAMDGWLGFLHPFQQYCKFPIYSDTQKICYNHSKIWTMWLYHRVISPNDADGMANSIDPDQTAPLGAVWSGSALFAHKLRIITVFQLYHNYGTAMLTALCNKGSRINYVQEWFLPQVEFKSATQWPKNGNTNSLVTRTFPLSMKLHLLINYWVITRSCLETLWYFTADSTITPSAMWFTKVNKFDMSLVKTCLQGFWPGQTQTSLLCYRS